MSWADVYRAGDQSSAYGRVDAKPLTLAGGVVVKNEDVVIPRLPPPERRAHPAPPQRLHESGDRWAVKGETEESGVVVRWHFTPRKGLFDPMDTLDGARHAATWGPWRRTTAVSEDGKTDVIVDEWRLPARRKWALGRFWVGATEFWMAEPPPARKEVGTALRMPRGRPQPEMLSAGIIMPRARNLLVRAKIGDTPINVVLDTGAAKSFIQTEVSVDMLRFPATKRAARGRVKVDNPMRVEGVEKGRNVGMISHVCKF